MPSKDYFNVLFNNDDDEDPYDSSGILQTMAGQRPQEKCQFGDDIDETIGQSFPRFQIVLIGKEGVGKSTTAFWLAYHLKTVESIKNSFVSAKSGNSFTTTFNMAELTSKLALTDTMGLPALADEYLCDIKHLLDGSLVQSAGKGMQWTEQEKCQNASARDPAPVRREYQAHSLLFLIRIPLDDDPERNEIKSLVQAMKQFKFHGSRFDLMDRIVFGIPDAPREKQKFTDLVERMNLPPSDTFPIVSAGTSTRTTEDVCLSAETFVPILKRLHEKSCIFFKQEVKDRKEAEENVRRGDNHMTEARQRLEKQDLDGARRAKQKAFEYCRNADRYNDICGADRYDKLEKLSADIDNADKTKGSDENVPIWGQVVTGIIMMMTVFLCHTKFVKKAKVSKEIGEEERAPPPPRSSLSTPG